MNVPFKRANILLPKNAEMEKWAVVACDQYTSEPEYWKEVENIVGDAPSTLKITLPEIYLEQDNVAERIANINKEMDHLLSTDFFKTLDNSLIGTAWRNWPVIKFQNRKLYRKRHPTMECLNHQELY